MPVKLEAVQKRATKPETKPVAKKQPTLPKPKAIPLDDKNRQIVNKAIAKKEVQKTVAPSEPKVTRVEPPKTKKVDQSYAIQLGSFSSQKNAIGLKRKLQKKKYHAYIEVIKTSKGISHRVRVGPYYKYDQITAIRKKINRSFKLNGKIVNYR